MSDRGIVRSVETEGQKQKEDEDALLELLKALESVDMESPLAELNETTISDNNGGRIHL
ncbi:hypothetical protein KA531_00575 [Candidatus Saccharibacteria bacterium]|nr:hypothetical protein [Candidatus Saccharibacteria bacterium]